MKNIFRIVLTLALLGTFNAAELAAQMSPFTCPIMGKRNNGNGSATAGAGKFINETGQPEPVLAAPYSGTTETSLLITGATFDLSGKYYRAVVSSDCSSANCASAARLTVTYPLPVTWLSFTGKPVGKQVVLDWSTATEINTRDFRVMHSIDGAKWNEIGSIPAAGNSSTTLSYRFVHTNPADGQNVYQLLQRDVDGRSEYSRVVKVILGKGETGLLVYPNPVEDHQIRVQLKTAATITLYNSIGAEVYRQAVPMGTHTLILPNLPAGTYRLRAGKETVPLIIQ